MPNFVPANNIINHAGRKILQTKQNLGFLIIVTGNVRIQDEVRCEVLSENINDEHIILICYTVCVSCQFRGGRHIYKFFFKRLSLSEFFSADAQDMKVYTIESRRGRRERDKLISVYKEKNKNDEGKMCVINLYFNCGDTKTAIVKNIIITYRYYIIIIYFIPNAYTSVKLAGHSLVITSLSGLSSRDLTPLADCFHTTVILLCYTIVWAFSPIIITVRPLDIKTKFSYIMSSLKIYL